MALGYSSPGLSEIINVALFDLVEMEMSILGPF